MEEPKPNTETFTARVQLFNGEVTITPSTFYTGFGYFLVGYPGTNTTVELYAYPQTYQRLFGLMSSQYLTGIVQDDPLHIKFFLDNLPTGPGAEWQAFMSFTLVKKD